MLATKPDTLERIETIVRITQSLDKLESVEVPHDSIDGTVSFLDNLFKGNYEQPTSKVRSN